MIVYNTTFHLDKEIEREGVAYLRQNYIPAALADGSLFHPRLYKVMSPEGEEGGSYSLQFHVQDIEILNGWLETVGKLLHQKLITRFGHRMAGFSTLLEVLDLG